MNESLRNVRCTVHKMFCGPVVNGLSYQKLWTFSETFVPEKPHKK